jgi:hypothetical protein
MIGIYRMLTAHPAFADSSLLFTEPAPPVPNVADPKRRYGVDFLLPTIGGRRPTSSAVNAAALWSLFLTCLFPCLLYILAPHYSPVCRSMEEACRQVSSPFVFILDPSYLHLRGVKFSSH